MTELIVGTAQFGASYGITNAAGRLSDDEVAAMLDAAARGGVTLFDTAPDYGDAQQRLGRFNRPHPGARYVSKFSLPPTGDVDEGRLIRETVTALEVPSLHGLLFHRPSDLRDERVTAAWASMRAAQDAGTVSRIGASIYDADDLAIAMTRLPGLDLLQIPASAVDRRLLEHHDVRRLHDAGVEVHVRSAYLQGLLLIDPAAIPDHLAELRPIVASLRSLAGESGRTVAALALGFLARHPVVDAVLVGATSVTELEQTLGAWSDGAAVDIELPDPHLPSSVVDPRAWPPRDPA